MRAVELQRQCGAGSDACRTREDEVGATGEEVLAAESKVVREPDVVVVQERDQRCARASAIPTLLGPAWSPVLRLRLMKRIRRSSKPSTTDAVSSVQWSPTTIISQSVNRCRRTLSIATRACGSGCTSQPRWRSRVAPKYGFHASHVRGYQSCFARKPVVVGCDVVVGAIHDVQVQHGVLSDVAHGVPDSGRDRDDGRALVTQP